MEQVLEKEGPLWKRTIIIDEVIEEETGTRVIEEMLNFLYDDEEAPITIMISSYGGSVAELFSIYDVIRAARQTCIVRTICYGKAYSAASLILASGTKGYRYMYPSAKTMIHGIQLYGIVPGAVVNTVIPFMESTMADYRKFIDMYSYETSKQMIDDVETSPSEEVMIQTSKHLEDLMLKDVYFSAEEAVNMGLADNIGIPMLEKEDPETTLELEDGEVLTIDTASPMSQEELEAEAYRNLESDNTKWEIIQ